MSIGVLLQNMCRRCDAEYDIGITSRKEKLDGGDEL